MNIPKKELSLLNNMDNVLNTSQSTINGFKIDEFDYENIIRTITLLLHRVNHFSSSLMVRKTEEGFKDIDFVRFIKYSLPATYNIKTGRVIINIQDFGKKEVTNIDPRSLYATIFYGYLTKLYTLKPLPIKENITVCDYVSDMIAQMFGKKYGILASYQDMLPKLRFVVICYILTSFFGVPQHNTYNRATRGGASLKDFNIDIKDYDLRDTKEFIKLLSDTVFNGISVATFVSFILKNKNLGIRAIPMFEDEMRFMATIGVSTLPSGGMYPPYLATYNRNMYNSHSPFFFEAIFFIGLPTVVYISYKFFSIIDIHKISK